MIHQKMIEELNKQIAKEMYSSNLYLAMAAYFHHINLNGFAHWMRLQAQEEMQHALKLFDHLLDRGGRPNIESIKEPQHEWGTPLEAFEDAFKHEQFITESISQIADKALQHKDFATMALMQWFIEEQVEEEAQTSELVDRLRLANDMPGAIFILDNELKGRNPAE